MENAVGGGRCQIFVQGRRVGVRRCVWVRRGEDTSAQGAVCACALYLKVFGLDTCVSSIFGLGVSAFGGFWREAWQELAIKKRFTLPRFSATNFVNKCNVLH